MQQEYVGIDLHRPRSVIVRKDANDELLSKVHIDNDPVTLAEAVAAAGPNLEGRGRSHLRLVLGG